MEGEEQRNRQKVADKWSAVEYWAYKGKYVQVSGMTGGGVGGVFVWQSLHIIIFT